MEDKTNEQKLIQLFENWSGEKALSVSKLPPSGSYREYYRLTGSTKNALGSYNSDRKENVAFIVFSKHFRSKHLQVPEIFETNLEDDIYLIQDLGDTTLFNYLTEKRKKTDDFSDELIAMYKKVIDEMPLFQIVAGKDLNYEYCYPRASFDKQSMMWDLNYFKYYFLKLAKIPFDEQKLEDDFNCFADYLLKTKCNYFLYRDFQSRNIMVHNNKPYFIDYQGGRKGALQYDIASLLYDAKANIPQNVRNILLDYYIKQVQKYEEINVEEFKGHYYGYVLIRIMQAMGAYGFRGFYEKKEHFLLSIPFAVKNIQWILENVSLPIEIPNIIDALTQIVNSDELKKYGNKTDIENNLTVTVNSFSFKRGIPVDNSGNGGGFVFDCRALPNPGRYEQYKHVTGKEASVIEFLKKESMVSDFLTSVFELADQSIEMYLHRKFTNLMISFGCTGGQHRSVYCAENLAKHISEKYNVNVIVKHIEQELKTE